jgi:hypothetical protein
MLHNKIFHKLSILILAIPVALVSLGAPAEAATGPCQADSSQICADISALSFTTNGTNSSISSGEATANLAATKFSFRFTSSSALANKYLTVHFYDISAGLHLLPTVGNETLSQSCAASGAIGKNCVIKTDANGGATFNIDIVSAEVGKGFSYHMLGPAGFSSSSVKVMYTVNGANVRAAEVCAGDRSKVCAPITRISATIGNSKLKVVYGVGGAGTAVLGTQTTLLRFSYTSSSEYAYKWAFMKFRNATAGVITILDSGDPTMSTACGLQDAVGNGCSIRLDATGSASFFVTIAGGAVGKSVEYVMSGPSFDSQAVTISFASAAVTVPLSTVKPSAVITGMAGLIKVVVKDAKAKSVSITLPGAPAAKFKPASNLETYYFPRAKSTVKVTVTIGAWKKIASVKVA